jgi:hypothetical protein
MSKRTHYLGALALTAAMSLLGVAGSARPLPADNDSGISRTELGRLDLFLDSHPDVAKALQANPALATNTDFLATHPAWKTFLEDHADIRQGLTANSTALMNQENRFDAAEAKSEGAPKTPPKPSMSDQFRSFDAFLDQHPAITKQLEANPSLIKDKSYLNDHPELVAFLKNNAAIRDSLANNPKGFMNGIATVDAADKSTSSAKSSGGSGSSSTGSKPTMPPIKAPADDNDSANVKQIAALDKFLDANTAVEKQLEADPTLINNRDFMNRNPDLSTFLKNHPDLAEDWRENPALTMRDLRRLDNLEAARSIGNSRAVDIRSAVQSFDNFLDKHPALEADIEHHPSAASNMAFIDAHPQLKDYLQKNPGVVVQLRNNPQSFMNLLAQYDKQAQQAQRGEKKEDLKPTIAVKHK